MGLGLEPHLLGDNIIDSLLSFAIEVETPLQTLSNSCMYPVVGHSLITTLLFDNGICHASLQTAVACQLRADTDDSVTQHGMLAHSVSIVQPPAIHIIALSAAVQGQD